jgi:hypothetical protein
MQLQNASVTGSAITMRDVLSYDAAARSVGSTAAFEATVGLVLRTLFKAHAKFAEIDLLYGNGPITYGNNVAIFSSSAIVTSSANAAVTVSYATWAPAMLSGFENAAMDAYETGVGKINTNAALQIVSVNVVPVSSTVGGVVIFSGNSTDISALVATNGTNVDFYWYGAYGNNMVGISGILTEHREPLRHQRGDLLAVAEQRVQLLVHAVDFLEAPAWRRLSPSAVASMKASCLSSARRPSRTWSTSRRARVGTTRPTRPRRTRTGPKP